MAKIVENKVDLYSGVGKGQVKDVLISPIINKGIRAI